MPAKRRYKPPKTPTPVEEYICNYPTSPIGGGNPYYKCSACGISDPQINGKLENHDPGCTWVRDYKANH